MERKISELIKESKAGDKNSLMDLIRRFDPLIKKYKRKLDYEDAESELIEHFIIIIKKIPIMAEEKEIAYISNSIKNKYIELSKKKELYFTRITLVDLTEQDFIDSSYEIESLDIKLVLKILPEKESKVLFLRYIYGYGDKEIANKLNISRQAVHKVRKKALEHLGHYLKGGDLNG